MLAVFQYRARSQHRIAYPADAGHGTGIAGAPIHHTGIQLVGALMGEYRAFTSIKQWALFQQPYRLGDRIQGAATLGQDLLAGGDDVGQRLNILLFLFSTQRRTGNCARAAMNGNHWFAHLPVTLC
ncbi:hypothetical protein D3C80_1423780 [compost metagenome]